MAKRACGFVIFRRFKGPIEYLMMQVSYGKHHWSPPKGHVEAGETDMETALRETKEEAGLEKNDLKIFHDAKHELNYKVKGQPKTVIYWLAELIKEDFNVKMSDEHQGFEWLKIEDACKFADHENMKECFRKFDKYIIEKLS